MHDSVGHQVDGKPLSQAGIAQDRRLGEPGIDTQAPPLRLRLPRLEHVADDDGQVDGLPQLEPALALRQGEQRVDQPFLLIIGQEYPRTGLFE